MSDNRRARRAKQLRRDERRAMKRRRGSSTDPTLRDGIRRNLGNPVGLLSIASVAVNAARPGPLTPLAPGSPDYEQLDRVLTSLIGARDREMTALLAVVGELLVDDPAQQQRCRREVASRAERLPRWISDFPHVDAYRAVRRTNAFGDVDEVVVGVRIGSRHELTLVVWIDHNLWSSIGGAGAVPKPIDEVLAQAAEASEDTHVREMSLADARAWIDAALHKPTFALKADNWPLLRALVRWLITHLPDGGEYRSPADGYVSHEEVCDRFFASSSAGPFTERSHRDLLLELLEAGTGDPLRWSAARVDGALDSDAYDGGWIPLEVALDAPDLLRAFIPYAHAQSGIRDDLTSRTLDMVDAVRSSYKRTLLGNAMYSDLDDAV